MARAVPSLTRAATFETPFLVLRFALDQFVVAIIGLLVSGLLGLHCVCDRREFRSLVRKGESSKGRAGLAPVELETRPAWRPRLPGDIVTARLMVTSPTHDRS